MYPRRNVGSVKEGRKQKANCHVVGDILSMISFTLPATLLYFTLFYVGMLVLAAIYVQRQIR